MIKKILIIVMILPDRVQNSPSISDLMGIRIGKSVYLTPDT